MCFGSIKSQIDWIKYLMKIYEEIYNDETISTIDNMSDFRKYCIETKHGFGSIDINIYLALKKGLPPLNFSDVEIEKLIEFLKKIKKIQKEYIMRTGGRNICVNPHFFLHYCFPERKIFYDYYPIKYGTRREHYEKVWEMISLLIKTSNRN